MKPPYLFTGELCTSPLRCELLFVFIVSCRRNGQGFFVLRTRNSDVILPKGGSSSGRSYVTEQWHNVSLLRTRALDKQRQNLKRETHLLLLTEDNIQYALICNWEADLSENKFLYYVYSLKFATTSVLWRHNVTTMKIFRVLKKYEIWQDR